MPRLPHCSLYRFSFLGEERGETLVCDPPPLLLILSSVARQFPTQYDGFDFEFAGKNGFVQVEISWAG